MRSIIFASLALLFCSFSCNKSKIDDLSGQSQIVGAVYINDNLRQLSQDIILPNQTILIKQGADITPSNYLYQVKSDSLGNFLFTNLSPKQYYIYATTISGGLTFSYQDAIIADDGSSFLKIVLKPDASAYNILSIQCKDAATLGALNSAKVCVFSSRLLANTNNCEGSIVSLPADAFGKTYTTHLVPGWYYLNAIDSVGNVNIRVKDSIQILSQTGLFTKELLLK